MIFGGFLGTVLGPKMAPGTVPEATEFSSETGPVIGPLSGSKMVHFGPQTGPVWGPVFGLFRVRRGPRPRGGHFQKILVKPI